MRRVPAYLLVGILLHLTTFAFGQEKEDLADKRAAKPDRTDKPPAMPDRSALEKQFQETLSGLHVEPVGEVVQPEPGTALVEGRGVEDGLVVYEDIGDSPLLAFLRRRRERRYGGGRQG